MNISVSGVAMVGKGSAAYNIYTVLVAVNVRPGLFFIPWLEATHSVHVLDGQLANQTPL
jgi:hypothetical protein